MALPCVKIPWTQPSAVDIMLPAAIRTNRVLLILPRPGSSTQYYLFIKDGETYQNPLA